MPRTWRNISEVLILHMASVRFWKCSSFKNICSLFPCKFQNTKYGSELYLL